MNNDIINLILNQWDKVILLISILCFFIREMYKSALKKKEIAFSMAHTEVLKSINNYVTSYFNYRTSMKNLPIEYLKPNYPAKKLDEMVTAPLNELKYCDFVLSLYLDENLYPQYNKITERAIFLNDRLHIILSASMNEIGYQNIYFKEFITFEKEVNKLLDNAFEETKLVIRNNSKKKWTINLFERRKKRQEEIMITTQKETNNSNSIPVLVDTITTLQNVITEKSKTIQSLEEKEKRLNDELKLLKNEDKIA